MIEFALSWPTRTLSPNGRVHWSKKAAAIKVQRHEANMLLRGALTTGATAQASAFLLHYTFCAPDRRRFDLDNALAQMKGATDGIAEALCVNDHTFSFRIDRGHPVKGGAVKVRLTWQG